MSKWKWFVFLVGCFLIFLGGCSAMLGQLTSIGSFPEIDKQSPYIGIVKVEGPIYSALSVLDQFKTLNADPKLKGVLLRIDSPGGAVGASQEIFRGVQRLVNDSIPVVVSCGNLAASGGLYSYLAASKIFANPGTLTGSIGVITQFPEADQLLDKMGLSFNTIKTGKHKDTGSPYRKMNNSDRKYIQAMVDESFKQFKKHILENRPISQSTLDSVADGRVINGEQAVTLGLIDTLGNIQDAHEYLAKITGVAYSKKLQSALPPKGILDELKEPLAKMSGWAESQLHSSVPMYIWK
jgi:protease-4